MTQARAETAPAETADGMIVPPLVLPPAWRRFDDLLMGLTRVTVFLVGATFTVLIVIEVGSRFLLDSSIAYTNATARFLLVWFFMIGAGLALRARAHVALTILTDRLPARPGRLVERLAQALVFLTLLLLLWSGWLGFRASLNQIEGSLGVSLAWVMAAFPIGFILLIYHQIAIAVGSRRSEA